MPPPTTQSGKAVLDSLTNLSRAANFRAGDFKALRSLQSTYKELEQIKRGVSSATASTRQLEKQFKTGQKVVDVLNKDVKEGKKLWDTLLKKIPGGGSLLSGAGKLAPMLGGLLVIGGVAGLVGLILKSQGEINEASFATDDFLQSDLTRVNSLAVRVGLRVKAVNAKVDKLTLEEQRTKDRVYGLEKQLVPIREKGDSTAKKVNDALYEVRQGRAIVEKKISIIATQLADLIKRPLQRGLQGIPGVAGKDGAKGKDGKNGIAGIPGKPGEKGTEGKPGKDGANGKDGKNGSDGKNGIPGINGRDGVDGKQGLQGVPGKPGKDGKDGKNGKDAEVDEQTKALIRQTAQNAAFIPALVARPTPLSVAETVTAAATGICKTTQPGGCTNKLVNDAKDSINSNTNNAKNSILDKINALANGAQLALLTKIDGKLGAEIIGGIAGGIKSLASNQLVTATVNYLTLITTLHNALMLSNNLIQTLFGMVDTVLKVVGLDLKDAEGNETGFTNYVSNAVKGIVISIVGEAQYKATSETFAKANRIYQATANLLNALQSIGQSILSALEVVGGYVGKIGNALRIWGAVSEKAYNFMNPQPNFNNRFFTGLEATNNVVSQVSSVASEVLSVKETVSQITTIQDDIKKEIGQGTGTKPGISVPEAASVKSASDAAKINSASPEITTEDKTIADG